MRKACVNTGKINAAAKDSVNAYVVFENAVAAVAARTANGRELDSHHLRVDAVNAPPPDPKRLVFLGNLPFDAKEDEVRQHFQAAVAGVEAVRIVRDRDTQMGKGFGYVLFNTRASAGAALRLNGTVLRNRPLRVTVCGKRTKGKKGDAGAAAADSFEGRRADGAKRRVGGKEKRAGAIGKKNTGGPKHAQGGAKTVNSRKPTGASRGAAKPKGR